MLYVVFLLYISKGVYTKMEPFIVNGDEAGIEKYPHSAFLEINCQSSWVCGASIINQNFVLTAAHCVVECPKSGRISVVVGNANRNKGFMTTGLKFLAHKEYDEKTMGFDIALVMVKTLPLRAWIKRVILLKDQPLTPDSVYVAGWGLHDEDRELGSSLLMEAKQTLVPRLNCSRVIYNLPRGTICTRGRGYAARGDSGSALVVDGYIQIGLVSFKLSGRTSRDLVVYTDVCYFYDWIYNSTREMYCS